MQYRSVLYIKGDIKCEILNIGVEKKRLICRKFCPRAHLNTLTYNSSMEVDAT